MAQFTYVPWHHNLTAQFLVEVYYTVTVTNNAIEKELNREQRRLEDTHLSDEACLGESQEYELSYLQSHKQRFKKIFESLPKQTNATVLDIGPTPFTFALSRYYSDGEVVTLDYTNLMKERCEEHGVIHKVHDLHNQPLPFDDRRFDAVTFHGVLEHLFTPPDPLFDEFERVLDVGGQLILGTPNFANLQNRVKLLAGVNPQEEIESEHVHGRGHVREYTLQECTQMIEESGLSVTEARWMHYKPFQERIKHGINETPLGKLPTPIAYAASTAYYTATSLIPSFRYHLYVVGQS